MSQYSGPYVPQDDSSAAQPSTTDVARDEAADVGRSARDAGSQVAQTAAGQAKQVVAETGRQARDLLGEAQGQATDQASVQQQRAAQQLHTVAGELHEMVTKGGQSGLATEVARQAADRIEGAASRLEQREPGDLLEGVRDFARRRPGAFLIGAAVAGLAAGRLTRGLTASGGSSQQSGPQQGTVGGVPAASTVTTTYPAGPAYSEPAYAEPAYATDAAYPADTIYPAEPGTAAGYGTGTVPRSGSGVDGPGTASEPYPENYYPDGGRESYRPGQP